MLRINQGKTRIEFRRNKGFARDFPGTVHVELDRIIDDIEKQLSRIPIAETR